MADQGKRNRIEAMIRARIASGTYPTGETLPPQNTLMEEFDAARETVRGALNRLAAAGHIDMGQGRPARVSAPTHAITLDGNNDAITWAGRLGDGARDILVSADEVEAPELVAQRLQRPAGTMVLRRVRHQFRDDALVVIMTQWVTVDTAKAIRVATGQSIDDVENPPQTDLFTLLHESGLNPYETTEVSYSRAATDEERAILSLPDDVPILITSRVSVNADGEPLEYANMPSRADMLSMEATFQIER